MISIPSFKVGLLVTCLLVAFTFCQNPNDRTQGWASDIDFLLSEISKQHYVYKSQPLPEALIKRAAELKQAIPEYSDERMLLELQRLMSFLGDGHSYVLPAGANRFQSTWLPVRFYLFADGLFIIDAQPGSERWIGSRVVSLGKVSAEDAVSRMGEMISVDNSMGKKWIGPILLGFRGGLEAVGVEVNANKVQLTLVDEKGQTSPAEFELTSVPRMRGLPKLIASKRPGAGAPPLYLENVSKTYWLKELPEQHALYFQFNQVQDDQSENLAAFARRLEQTLTTKPPQLLVIDVRHNNGGNADLLPPLLGVLKRFEAANPRSKTIVVTGRNTFSAAQIFISLVNRDTKAVFVGEPSSSKPNFVGEENQVVLPWSGAMGSISNRYHESIPGDKRQWIDPQIKVELSSGDYFSNRDSVLEKVLQLSGRYGSGLTFIGCWGKQKAMRSFVTVSNSSTSAVVM